MDRTPCFLENFLRTEFTFIFLGGVHGVGKTTVCEQVFTPAGYRCVTASSLIKAYGVRPDQNKRVQKVADNQVAPIEQLDFEKQHHDRLLLDGHYCLNNGQNQIEPIDIEVFGKIRPDTFVLLKDCPNKIAKRLKNRDGKKWDGAFVEQFQEAEEQHAEYISYKLNIPFQIIFNNEGIA